MVNKNLTRIIVHIYTTWPAVLAGTDNGPTWALREQVSDTLLSVDIDTGPSGYQQVLSVKRCGKGIVHRG